MKFKNDIDWSSLSIASPEFLKARNDDNLIDLLHGYFSRNNTPNPKLLGELAHSSPDLLLEGIRFNRAFLNENHFSSLDFLESCGNEKLQTHYAFFTQLKKQHDDLFEQFNNLIQQVKDESLVDVFLIASLWFEEKRAVQACANVDMNNANDLNAAIETINYFTTCYITTKQASCAHFEYERDEDFVRLIQILNRADRYQYVKEQVVWRCLNAATNYLYFLRGVIEIYCFDHNYDVIRQGDILHLYFTEYSVLRRWHIDNVKIMVWHEYYRSAAEEVVNDSVTSIPGYIIDRTGHDYDMNLEGDIREKISFLVAYDYSMLDGLLAQVPVISVMDFLKGFIANASGRFVRPLDKLHAGPHRPWLQNLVHYYFDFGPKGIAAPPLRILHKDELHELIAANIPKASGKADTLIALISSNSDSVEVANPYKPAINFVGKPFVQFGDYFVALNGILGETNSHTNFLINILESNHKLNTRESGRNSARMEAQLAADFKRKGFANVMNSLVYKSDSGVNGDFDVLVWEDNVLLIIEMKCSKFRVHLSDAHDDYQNNLVKASRQLDKAVHFITNDFETFKAKSLNGITIRPTSPRELKILTLIVSTSFENDHQLIKNKHLKITLFELQRILSMETEMSCNNKLESIFDFIVRDRFWEPVRDAVVVPSVDDLIQSVKI